MSKAAKKHEAARRGRREALRDPAKKGAITRATDRLAALAHPDQDYIVIRSEFIYREPARPYPPAPDRPEDISTRPPQTQILNTKNPHANPIYLTGLFVEQMSTAHRNTPTPPPVPTRRHNVYNIDSAPSWTSLCGLAEDGVLRRNQRKRFNRALDALRESELIDLGATGQRYTKFRFNREDGSGRPYTIPQGEPTAPTHLYLPTQFFTAGWHLVLTPSELATFLAVCHVSDRLLARRTESSFFLAESERYRRLGLSDEAYLSIHQLSEFSLIDLDDPMPNRRRGRIRPSETGDKRPQPYHLTATVLGGMASHNRFFNLDALKRPAIEVAIERLSWPMARYA